MTIARILLVAGIGTALYISAQNKYLIPAWDGTRNPPRWVNLGPSLPIDASTGTVNVAFPPQPPPGVPYTGATADVDLGAHRLKAASVETTSSPGVGTRLDMTKGTCPTVPPAGKDATLCLNSDGSLWLVNSDSTVNVLVTTPKQ